MPTPTALAADPAAAERCAACCHWLPLLPAWATGRPTDRGYCFRGSRRGPRPAVERCDGFAPATP
ncbi:MAG TPA: hypothetical protein VGE72_13140, partial [Azospirillum sp.]